MAKRRPRKRYLPEDVTEYPDKQAIRELFPEEVVRRMDRLVGRDSDTDSGAPEPDEDQCTPEG